MIADKFKNPTGHKADPNPVVPVPPIVTPPKAKVIVEPVRPMKSLKQLQSDYDSVYADIQTATEKKKQLEKTKKGHDLAKAADLAVEIEAAMAKKLEATKAIDAFHKFEKAEADKAAKVEADKAAAKKVAVVEPAKEYIETIEIDPRRQARIVIEQPSPSTTKAGPHR